MTAGNRTEEVFAFLRLSQNEAMEQAGRMYAGDLSDYSRILESIAEKAARLAEYCERRGGAGCGDEGHDNAAAGASRVAKRVRKALGYAYP